jgi:uncharacterized protein YpmB
MNIPNIAEIKAKLIVGAIVGVLLLAIVGSAVWYFKSSQAEIKKLAVDKAVAETQLRTTNAALNALSANVQEIARLTKETNDKMSALRTAGTTRKNEVNSYDAGKAAKTNIDDVEKWANATSNKNLANINETSKK